MRDRSRARNYCASRDEFRRTHERHRAWGLQRRHAERLRQLRDREAGCWPADLEVVGAGVEGGRSGVADELSAGSARLLVRCGARGRACDPPAGSIEPARSARRAGPAGKPPPHADQHTVAKPSSPPSNHGRRPTPAPSHEQAPSRDRALQRLKGWRLSHRGSSGSRVMPVLAKKPARRSVCCWQACSRCLTRSARWSTPRAAMLVRPRFIQRQTPSAGLRSGA